MSLIDQDHTGTWGDAGIIVEVPEQNIVATSNQDMGSMNSDPAFLKQQFASSIRYKGDELMQMTAPQSYNEVVAFANVDDSKIGLKGFFYKTDRNGEPINETVARKMQMHALRLGLPVVTVQTPGMYPNNEVKIEKDDKIAVHLNGCRYLLSGYDDSNFKVFDEKRSSFMSADQMKEITTFLEEQGYGDNFINVIIADYEEANTEHQRAKFTFDDNGDVESVKKSEGYGNSVTEYFISAKGYARTVNKAVEMRRLEKSMFSNGLQMIDLNEDDGYRPMSRSKAELLIAEASETLSDAEKVKVQEWSAEILPDLETKSQQNYGRRHDVLGGGFSSPRFL